MRGLTLFVLPVLLIAGGAVQAPTPTTVFKGRPAVKVSEAGITRKPERISPGLGVNLECVISKIGDRYFWASRENVELLRVDGGGAFVTFVAKNGSGYIRLIKPDLKEAASLMSDTETQFDYVEHLLVGLRTVTYYGKSSG